MIFAKSSNNFGLFKFFQLQTCQVVEWHQNFSRGACSACAIGPHSSAPGVNAMSPTEIETSSNIKAGFTQCHKPSPKSTSLWDSNNPKIGSLGHWFYHIAHFRCYMFDTSGDPILTWAMWIYLAQFGSI